MAGAADYLTVLARETFWNLLQMTACAAGMICLRNRSRSMTTQTAVIINFKILVVLQHIRSVAVIMTFTAFFRDRLAFLGFAMAQPAGDDISLLAGCLVACGAIPAMIFYKLIMTDVCRRMTIRIVAIDTFRNPG